MDFGRRAHAFWMRGASRRVGRHAQSPVLGGRLRVSVGRSTAYGIDPQFPAKPPRMRWRTYAELQRKDEALLSRFLAGAAADATCAVQCLSRRRPRGRSVKVHAGWRR